MTLAAYILSALALGLSLFSIGCTVYTVRTTREVNRIARAAIEEAATAYEGAMRALESVAALRKGRPPELLRDVLREGGAHALGRELGRRRNSA